MNHLPREKDYGGIAITLDLLRTQFSVLASVFVRKLQRTLGREQVITTQLTFWKMANIVETDLADEARPAPEENKKYRMIWWVAAQVIKQIIVVSFYLIQDGWRKLCWVGEADGAGRGGAGGAAAHSASFAGRVVETFNTGHWSAWSPLPAGENIERAVISGVFPNRQYIT